MYKRILVAVDGSKTSNLALKEAIKLAKDQRANLRLIHVVDETPIYMMAEVPYSIDEFQKSIREAGRKELAKCADRAKAARIKFDTKLLVTMTRSVGDMINQEAKRWSANLIVIGTHGRRGFNRLVLGSVAERVIRSAAKPTLIIRGR
jgi:nucleotide-binding universal stress UspA family protein